jgi:hypothetical protein
VPLIELAASLSGPGRSLRILFVPVSGAFGMGEYARSLAIAVAAKSKWQQADIHFILSREAPYAASVPFPSTLLASSPTFHSAAVIELIDRFRPHVVIFDNAGRSAQLRAASRAGARIVFISARSRQRRKAFRARWMRLLDEHWIAYPALLAGELNVWERFKLKLLKRPVVRYLDVILARASSADLDSVAKVSGFGSEGYVLVVPGGGTGHPRALKASGEFLAAARSLAASGFNTVFVGPHQGGDSQLATLRSIESLPQAQLMELMRGAKLVVANGGSTLLQAIACGCACIAIPIAHDQAERIRRCVSAAVAVPAALHAASMVEAATLLLNDEEARAALACRAHRLGLADGVQVALDALAQLLEAR